MVKKTIIEAEIIKIKKPKDDEILIFKMPAQTTPEQMEQINKFLRKKIKKKEPSYISTNADFEIKVVKKKNVKAKR